MSNTSSRRQVIKTGVLAAIGSSFIGKAGASPMIEQNENDDLGWQNFKVGVASYSFRKMTLEDTIKALKRLSLHYISIKDFHLPLTSSTAERQAAMQKLKDAGITALSCGNITMQHDEKGIRQAFQYARDCNIPTIVCSPDPASMSVLDKMVKEYDIKLAIHNHGPEDKRFPSPYDVMKAVQGFDKRIGLCIDVGHTARARVNPSEAILKCKERLYDLHFKDIDSTKPDGATVEAGRGVLDLPAIVRSLKKVRFDGLVSIEFEGWENDPLPAVAETVGYAKALFTTNKDKKTKASKSI
ncbi:MAG TPA: sugar phosphate isomerase/epimerase [Chitinophagaceae bacterium]|nr:sugar phosphate isomerase/epimerase [Chitinophagaceae bacterium]